MLKHKDKSISAYRGDYRPVSIFENCRKIHGFNTAGMTGDEAVFANTYNDSLTIFGKSEYARGVNLCPAPQSLVGMYWANNIIYNYSFTAKENGYFDFNGAMVMGETIAKTTLKPGTYTVSGCSYVQLWWEELNDFFYIPGTFTLEKETEIQACFWYTSTENILLENQYIQIEKGETASVYSPYVGNRDFEASPDNFCKIAHASGEIRVEGGNLLPPDFGAFSQWECKTADNPDDGYVFYLDLSPGEYLFRFDVVGDILEGTYGYMCIQESTDNGENYYNVHRIIQLETTKTRFEFNANENCKYRFWVWKGMVLRENIFAGWSLQTKAIPEGNYPYSPVYNIVCPSLAGIEVGENDGYNYFEEVNNQKHYYVSNVLSGETLERNIGEMVFTGEEAFLQKDIESETLNCYYCDVSNVIKGNRTADNFLCNCFERLVSSKTEKIGALLGQNDTNLYFFVDKSKFGSPEDFMKWLKYAYIDGCPLIFYYIMDTPQKEVIFAETPLRTYPMYTHISIESTGGVKPGLLRCIKIQNNTD